MTRSPPVPWRRPSLSPSDGFNRMESALKTQQVRADTRRVGRDARPEWTVVLPVFTVLYGWAGAGEPRRPHRTGGP